jgi:uncharacterized membrane-anchored protein
MAIKWSISTLDYEISKDSKSNVVTSVHWNANDSKEVTKDGEKVTYYGRIYGSIGVDSDWKDNAFVAYDKLDEDTVVGWVKAKLGDEQVKSVEDGIANEIDAKENPTTGKGKPW